MGPLADKYIIREVINPAMFSIRGSQLKLQNSEKCRYIWNINKILMQMKWGYITQSVMTYLT